MAWYLAVIRLSRNNSPQKFNFNKNTDKEAFQYMLKMTNCSSVAEFKEYELYEILENGNMAIISSKGETVTSPRNAKRNAVREMEIVVNSITLDEKQYERLEVERI